MRTTVTLEADAEAIVRRRMRERGVSFKEALNDTIRRGAAPAGGVAFSTATAAMGVTRVNLDRALQVAGDLEDDELVRRMRARS
ncbi:MAG: antitoxin [Acidimicrobiales bacterium]